MKILNVMQCTNLGGMEKVSLTQMLWLKARGHNISVISLNKFGKLGSELRKNFNKCVDIGYRGKWGWRSVLDLRKNIKSVDADVVLITGHSFMAMLSLMGVERRKLILCIHYHHGEGMAGWKWKIIYKIAARMCSCITFPSCFVMDEAIKIESTIKSKAVLIRNPIMIVDAIERQDKTTSRLRLNLPLDSTLVGNAGWLIKRKRFDVFIEVADLVSKIDRNIKFVIAGSGGERELLEGSVSKHGLEGTVLFIGEIENIGDFYQSIDILLFNTDWDAFPTTPLEAMSYGVPVIASSINGGLKEVITNGVDGILFDTHNIEGMAKAILRLAKPTGSEAAELGMRGKTRVRELCRMETVASEFENIILE